MNVFEGDFAEKMESESAKMCGTALYLPRKCITLRKKYTKTKYRRDSKKTKSVQLIRTKKGELC